MVVRNNKICDYFILSFRNSKTSSSGLPIRHHRPRGPRAQGGIELQKSLPQCGWSAILYAGEREFVFQWSKLLDTSKNDSPPLPRWRHGWVSQTEHGKQVTIINFSLFFITSYIKATKIIRQLQNATENEGKSRYNQVQDNCKFSAPSMSLPGSKFCTRGLNGGWEIGEWAQGLGKMTRTFHLP